MSVILSSLIRKRPKEKNENLSQSTASMQPLETSNESTDDENIDKTVEKNEFNQNTQTNQNKIDSDGDLDNADVTSLFAESEIPKQSQAIKDIEKDRLPVPDVLRKKSNTANNNTIKEDKVDEVKHKEAVLQNNESKSLNSSDGESVIDNKELIEENITKNVPETFTDELLNNASTDIRKSEKPKLFPEIDKNQFETANNDFVVAFSQSIESLSIEVLNHHIVPNLSLAAFGDAASLYRPHTLEIINFGEHHKFIGRRLNLLELHKLYYKLEKIFLDDPTKDHFTLKLTYPISYKDVSYTTLVATPEDLKSFSAICGYEVKVDFEELDESQLVAVIRKCV